jgi:ATP-dependent DNA helicase RecG
MFKYTPLYANGKEPIIEEQDLYRIEIPYIPTLQGSTFDTTQKSTQKSTQRILDLIRENPYVTTQEMADSIGIIRRIVAKHIKSLQENGVIKRVGPDKGGHWEVVED